MRALFKCGIWFKSKAHSGFALNKWFTESLPQRNGMQHFIVTVANEIPMDA